MTSSSATTPPSAPLSEAPYPGSKQMPRWNLAELPPAPTFSWKNWWTFLGPGLLMGGAAIGGGEWLTGPIVTAKYGGGLLWLATLSILAQVLYNIEISRYTLYTGEPIFTGKFRTLPGPMFWVCLYLVLDFGSVFPYLAASAATPVAAIILGKIPTPDTDPWHADLMRWLGIGIFLLSLIPMFFGGKIYNSLKAIMTFKIFTVMGFLLVLALFFSHIGTWEEIFGGFFKFGQIPIECGEDRNGNGILDPGEDWDGDGKLDQGEDTNLNGKLDPGEDLNGNGRLDFVEEKLAPTIASTPGGPLDTWADIDGDGKPDKFRDIDHDGIRDGENLDNVFKVLYEGRPLPPIDLSMVAFLSALVAISGQGGLSNTPISNYTRDSGWGMGSHVGAIPSLVGGHDIQLSHVGTVFPVNSTSLVRWKGWYKHVMRDQLVLWLPACFFGLALPSMLSVEFLRRGTDPGNNWVAAGMTADAVRETVVGRIGPQFGYAFWFMTLFCGFLVLAPTMASTIDGVIRRWVDVFWTASKTLHRLDSHKIKHLYFGVLLVYSIMGISMLLLLKEPANLLKVATSFYNFALGISCWHVLGVNLILLPRELRPGWFVRIFLFLAGFFFLVIATVSAIKIMKDFGIL